MGAGRVRKPTVVQIQSVEGAVRLHWDMVTVHKGSMFRLPGRTTRIWCVSFLRSSVYSSGVPQPLRGMP